MSFLLSPFKLKSLKINLSKKSDLRRSLEIHFSLSIQHFLNFLPLPHGQGSFRPYECLLPLAHVPPSSKIHSLLPIEPSVYFNTLCSSFSIVYPLIPLHAILPLQSQLPGLRPTTKAPYQTTTNQLRAPPLIHSSLQPWYCFL